MWYLQKSLPVKLVQIHIDRLTVTPEKTAYSQLNTCASEYQSHYEDTTISEIPGVAEARQLFHAIGLDPTRRRPSSEALLQRALKGKPLYSVNTLVDVSNWCSLDFLLPICAYDADKIEGDVMVRLGRPGESYLALNHSELSLSDRFCLADEFGPFGSPLTDSQRTAVTEDTHRTILCIFAPSDYDQDDLKEKANIFADRVLEYCTGVVQQMLILANSLTFPENDLFWAIRTC